MQNFKVSKVKKLIKITSFVLIISFYSFGSIKSFNQIKYSYIEKNELISMASQADFAFQYELFSLYWTHGSEEFKSVQNKYCKDPLDKSKSRTAFLYSHRIGFNPNDLKQMKFLENASNGCISSDSNISIIKSIERNNRRDIEMDNKIFNGGSSIYGYLIKVN